ncbi:MAG TPA: thioether cross-link-forming SCIFF peptide maturase [Syntrophomonadaceae bacterium]|nr:thioether cross-link-forming SCIFF peptide maturase [Syntrophomonadaceae bacterium]
MFFLAAYNFEANLHMYKFGEANIVMDINSGAIHMFDDVAYALLQNLVRCQGDMYHAAEICGHTFPPAQVSEAVVELMALYEEGSLFTEDEDIHFDWPEVPVKALCLNIAHTCNMRCTYCFAGQGNFGLQEGLMPIDIGRQALDFLIDRSQGIKHLEVDFFGGEPLLNQNMMKELVEYGRQREAETGKRFNFTLTTNALLLNEEIINWVIDNDISVILSLDGRPEVNDRHRIMANGQGSYNQILPHIKKMVEKHPVSYFVRGTFTRENLDFSEDLKHLAEMGFDAISLEPAVGQSELAIKKEDLPQVIGEYEKLTQLLLDYFNHGHNIQFFHYDLNLQQGPCIAKRCSGCGAGCEYLVVTPNGDIYPCHQFIGEAGFYMGNIKDGKIDRKIVERFQHNRLKDKECRYCWARYFCGGGCHASALHQTGDMSKPDPVACTMQQKRIENAIYLDIKKNAN